MKNSRVRMSEVRSNEASMPATEAFVRIQITGICGLVVDSAHSPLIVVMPDAREPRFTTSDPSMEIASHRAFVMFPAAAASGREPDFRLRNGELGVCLLEREMLSLAGGTIDPLPPGGGSAEIVRMSNVCAHGLVARSCVTFPPRDGVLAQVNVPSNALWAQSLSDDDYTFEPRCRDVNFPQSGRLAEVVAVDLRISDASTLQLLSHPFSGGPTAGAIELSLENTTAEAPLVVTIGNVPLPDLQRYVDATPGGHVHDRDVHFELYYSLASVAPQLPFTIPTKQMAMKVPHASNCPAAIMDIEPDIEE